MIGRPCPRCLDLVLGVSSSLHSSGCESSLDQDRAELERTAPVDRHVIDGMEGRERHPAARRATSKELRLTQDLMARATRIERIQKMRGGPLFRCSIMRPLPGGVSFPCLEQQPRPAGCSSSSPQIAQPAGPHPAGQVRVDLQSERDRNVRTVSPNFYGSGQSTSTYVSDSLVVTRLRSPFRCRPVPPSRLTGRLYTNSL